VGTIDVSRPTRGATLDEHVWSANLARVLADRSAAGEGAAVTWYNHASLRRSLDAGVDVAEFDHVGIDGVLLRRLVAPGLPRTSADLLLPVLIQQLPGCRVALVGGNPSANQAAAATLEALPSAPTVVYACDGYAELPSPAELAGRLRAASVHVVVLGLGAPLQDAYCLALKDAGMTRELLITCGGWLDQVAQPRYYPAFAYRLRLNWLVRVCREPGRLWRRYTTEALHAHRHRARFRQHLLGLAGGPLAAMAAACLGQTMAAAEAVSATSNAA
jgi:UDP-N-acetyl-D-mannosaminuronic acid transferase (WecB/TagA/CpsF family)